MDIFEALSGGDRRSIGKSGQVVAYEQMLPRLDLSPSEKQMVIALLFGYLDDESLIVKTFSMTALADLETGLPVAFTLHSLSASSRTSPL